MFVVTPLKSTLQSFQHIIRLDKQDFDSNPYSEKRVNQGNPDENT